MFLARRDFTIPPLFALRRDLDRLFDGFFDDIPARMARPFPAMNAWERDDRLVVEAELPGLALNDIEITVQGNELTIKGHRNVAEDEKVVYHRRERGTGEFVRHVALPVEIDADKVEATLKDGVLTIELPKAERALARKIAVKTV